MTSRDIPALLSIAGFLGVFVLFGFVFWNQPPSGAAPPPDAHGTRDGHNGIIGSWDGLVFRGDLRPLRN